MELRFFDTVLRAKKEYSRSLDPICKAWGLTRNELDVLLFLFNNPDLDRAADIVTHRGMAKSHVSLSVTNLEARGLLTRQADPRDRRTVHLKLSQEAENIAREGRDAQRRFFSRIYRGLTAQELDQWRTSMLKVCNNIDKLDE